MAECMMKHHAHGNKEKDARRPETRHTGLAVGGLRFVRTTRRTRLDGRNQNSNVNQLSVISWESPPFGTVSGHFETPLETERFVRTHAVSRVPLFRLICIWTHFEIPSPPGIR